MFVDNALQNSKKERKTQIAAWPDDWRGEASRRGFQETHSDEAAGAGLTEAPSDLSSFKDDPHSLISDDHEVRRPSSW